MESILVSFRVAVVCFLAILCTVKAEEVQNKVCFLSVYILISRLKKEFKLSLLN